MKLLETNDEFEQALKALGYEVIDHGYHTFSVRNRVGGDETPLLSEDYGSALIEAYGLVQ